MNSRERYRIISTGRGRELRNLAQGMTNHPDDFPTKSGLREALAELYPGDEHAKLRESLFGKLTELAQARAQGGYDLLELRGIADELVLKVETRLAEEERLVSSADDELDAKATAQAVLDAHEDATTINGPNVRRAREERAEALELVRKAGLA